MFQYSTLLWNDLGIQLICINSIEYKSKVLSFLKILELIFLSTYYKT